MKLYRQKRQRSTIRVNLAHVVTIQIRISFHFEFNAIIQMILSLSVDICCQLSATAVTTLIPDFFTA